jgi:hypothetical protein
MNTKKTTLPEAKNDGDFSKSRTQIDDIADDAMNTSML